MAIRRLSIASLATLAVLAAGCGQKTAQNTPAGASSDSLLASSPIESQQGQLQPQTTPPPQPAPAPTPAVTTPEPKHTAPPAQAKPKPKPPAPEAPSAIVSAGTGVKITMGTALTSETATVGQ